MNRKNVLSLCILIIVALMPFAALGEKREEPLGGFVCMGGDRELADKSCIQRCKGWPYYVDSGRCKWDEPFLWFFAICVCFT
ncbi:hypothetical protein ABFS83_09G079900 [Erythranthe nasuta]